MISLGTVWDGFCCLRSVGDDGPCCCFKVSLDWMAVKVWIRRNNKVNKEEGMFLVIGEREIEMLRREKKM